MSVKFFGQFLIERGENDAEQVREALELMKSENRDVGELAIAEGYLSREDCLHINAAQRDRNLPFGALAIELGLLTGSQLDQVLQIQNETRLFMGAALVRLGYLAEDRAALLLDEFKLDQAIYQPGQLELPASLGANRLAVSLLDLIPKFCMRMSRIHVKLCPARQMGQIPTFEFRVELIVRGDPGVGIILMGDREFGAQLAAGVSGLDPRTLDRDMVKDGMGEFLNVLAGNVVALLEPEGIVAAPEPPSYDVEPEAGWILEVVASEGRGALLLGSPVS